MRNQFHLPRRLLIFVWTFVFIGSLSLSCTDKVDNSIIPNPKGNSVEQISDVKRWFDLTLPEVDYLSAGTRKMAKFLIQPDWTKVSFVSYEGKQYVIAPVNLGNSKNIDLPVRYLLIEKVESDFAVGRILEISTDKQALALEPESLLNFYLDKIPKDYTGEIKTYNIGYTPLEFRVFNRGQVTKLQKLSVGKPSKNTSARQTCIDWYLETYVNGILSSSVYIKTTCSCENTRQAALKANAESMVCGSGGGGGGDSPSSYTTTPANSSLDDTYLCPNSIGVQQGSGGNSIRLLSTWGIKVGVGSNFMTYGIDAVMPSVIFKSDVTWDQGSMDTMAQWGKDFDAFSGVDDRGSYYTVSNGALRLLLARASDYAVRDFDSNRVYKLSDRSAYREEILTRMQDYLTPYFGSSAYLSIDLPFSRPSSSTPNATLVSNWYDYWTGNCR